MTSDTTNQACAEYKTDYAILIRTAAKWSIPRDLAVQVIRRDLKCVYCRHIFAAPYEDRARMNPTCAAGNCVNALRRK